MGIDPSLTGTGVVVLEDGKMIEKVLIKTKKKGDGPSHEIERLRDIVGEVEELIEKHNPDIVCMEGLAFQARNTTALVQLAGLNYLLRDVFSTIPWMDWVIVAPSSLKKYITGAGNTAKDVMMMETYKRYSVTLTDDNLCDAYGLAQVGTGIKGGNIKPLTKAQKEVVTLLGPQTVTI